MFSLAFALFTSHSGGGLASPLAYLDPGSGSYILQLLIAGVLGGFLALRLSWGRIKAFFSRRRGETTAEDEPKDEGSG